MTEILHRTRSMRLIVRPVETPVEIVVENLDANEGLEMEFTVNRGIEMPTSSASVKIYNLPEDLRGRIAGQARTIGEVDDVIGGPQALWNIGQLDNLGSQATPAALGYATVELQAGYDGVVSTIFTGTLLDCIVSDDRITSETVLTAGSGIAQVALSAAGQTFEAGSDTFAVLDTLRRVLKLGPGNCTPTTWLQLLAESALIKNRVGQAVFSATSVLTAPYIVTDNADQQLEALLKWTGVRHFIDEGELWLVGRLGFIPGAPAVLEPLKERPRSTTSGQLDVQVYLTPGARPGHAVYLDATDVDPTVTGAYRCDHVTHIVSSSADGEGTTTAQLTAIQGIG